MGADRGAADRRHPEEARLQGQQAAGGHLPLDAVPVRGEPRQRRQSQPVRQYAAHPAARHAVGVHAPRRGTRVARPSFMSPGRATVSRGTSSNSPGGSTRTKENPMRHRPFGSTVTLAALGALLSSPAPAGRRPQDLPWLVLPAVEHRLGFPRIQLQPPRRHPADRGSRAAPRAGRARDFTCPILRDNEANTTGLQVLRLGQRHVGRERRRRESSRWSVGDHPQVRRQRSARLGDPRRAACSSPAC